MTSAISINIDIHFTTAAAQTFRVNGDIHLLRKSLKDIVIGEHCALFLNLSKTNKQKTEYKLFNQTNEELINSAQ